MEASKPLLRMLIPNEIISFTRPVTTVSDVPTNSSGQAVDLFSSLLTSSTH